MNKTKGFTIIELIVVIAIIAILAAIVLVNVTSYITKGKDASAKGDLDSLTTNMADYYNTNGTYPTGIATLASSSQAILNVYNALTATSMGYTVTYNGSGSTGWCAMITEKASTNTYCVDGTGNKLEKSGGSCTTAAGLCQ